MQKTLLIFLFVILGLWWFQGGKLPAILADRTLDKGFLSSVAKLDSCAGKKTCLFVYVAPWCPACKSMEPVFRLFVNKNANSVHGTKIVVGQGKTSEDNASMAKLYGEAGFVDEGNAYHEKLKVRHYPTIIHLDASGRILARDNDALQWAATNILSEEDRRTLSGR